MIEGVRYLSIDSAPQKGTLFINQIRSVKLPNTIWRQGTRLLSKEFSINSIFFLQAVASGGLFTRIPDIQRELGLSESELGLTLAAQPIGGFFSFLIASLIVERAGAKIVCILGVPMLAAASAMFASAPDLPVAIVSLLIFGMSFSVVNVAMNVEADRIEASLGRRVMSRCHGYWSLGFLAASIIGVFSTGIGLSAGLHLVLVVPLVILGIILTVMPLSESEPRRHQGQDGPSMVTLPSLATLGIVCFGLLGSVLQGGTQNWSVIYMRQSFEVPDWMDALTIPVFLIALTCGRLSGDVWLNKFGVLRVAFCLVTSALIGVLTVVMAGSYGLALAGFALIGLGVSIIFPMMVTAAAALGDRAASANVAAVTMTTGIGMLAVPPIMGFFAENYGIRAAFAALIPAFVLAYATIRNIVPKQSN